MLVGERFKFRDNLLELPGRGVNKLTYIRTGTNLRNSTLLAFSAWSLSLTGEASTADSDCTLRSISFIPSVLSDVCWSRKRVRGEEVINPRTGSAHIVALYQDGHSAYDRLQRRERIRSFLGDFYGHPGHTICCLPARASCSYSRTTIGRVVSIGECRANGEGDDS